MKYAYLTIHPGKNPPPQNSCRLKSVFFFLFLFSFLKAPVFTSSTFPNSTGLFTKPTGHHHTKYRFSPDIGYHLLKAYAMNGY
jgi:hypothetical protein